MNVTLASPAGKLSYSDSPDHLETGLLRLMNLSREELERWLELAESSGASGVLQRLREGWSALRPLSAGESAAPLEAGPAAGSAQPEPAAGSGEPGPLGRRGLVRPVASAATPTPGVAVAAAPNYGWHVRREGGRIVRETTPPPYEEEYFEGDRGQAGGYGDYLAQAGWRLEKAARQVREMRERTGLAAGRVLDVGSGYGFFRVALGEAGYRHDGVEVSEHAREVARRTFGMNTHGGTLEEHLQEWEARYDAVTMFDLIEHLADPQRLVAQAAHVLAPGGVLGIKTPNLDCPEAEVFGAHYHSLKREHLAYFSADSLTAMASGAGLELVHVASVSHLLVGFVGRTQTERWERELRGADLVVWYRRTGE